jgi:hypothetical protein
MEGAEFPRNVIVKVSGPAPAGLAVVLIFPMRSRNPFFYTLFVDAAGHAQVSGEELLTFFDQARAQFVNEYVDPRAGFAGEVFAEVLGAVELESSREALEMFRGKFVYPPLYEEKLKAAILRGVEADAHEIESIEF